jgi:hypothetical protein
MSFVVCHFVNYQLIPLRRHRFPLGFRAVLGLILLEYFDSILLVTNPITNSEGFAAAIMFAQLLTGEAAIED